MEEVADVTKVSFWELRAPFVLYYSTQNFKLDFKIKHILLLKQKMPVMFVANNC